MAFKPGFFDRNKYVLFKGIPLRTFWTDPAPLCKKLIAGTTTITEFLFAHLAIRDKELLP
jgi:hypothetical protein